MNPIVVVSRATPFLPGLVALAIAAAVVGCAVSEPPEARAEAARPPRVADVQPPERPVRQPRQDAAGLRTSFSDILEPALESVVSIETLSTSKGRDPHAGLGLPFGFGMPDDQFEDAFGSGVVVSADGIILTNNHVVEDADEVRIRFFDNREMKATVLGTDPLTDIAVIKVDAKDLPYLPLGTSADLRVGDLVFAIGSPFSLAQSVTMGIVSATGRSKIGITRGGYENFIQTDAPINPGNSGGALLDSRGEVVGVNTAIFSSGARGNQGIGFAVPIDMARNVMEQIVSGGHVVRAQLGVGIKEVDASLAKSFGLDRPMGALVVRVERGSPAEAAGLKEEDVIVELDGKGVANDAQLRLDISNRKPGTTVALAVLRDVGGRFEKRSVEATLRRMSADHDAPVDAPAALEDRDNALRGVAVQDLDELMPAQRQRLGLSDLAAGALVTEVAPLSPAARAGIRPGDVVTWMNQQPVTGASEFRSMARSAGKTVVRVRVQRGGTTDIVAVEP